MHTFNYRIGRPRTYYEEMMSKLNGWITTKRFRFVDFLIKSCSWTIEYRILLPGSGLNITRENHVESPVIQAARFVIGIAKHLNEIGIYFPVYGECFGLELLLYATNENPDYLTQCSCTRLSLPLNFTKGMFMNGKKPVGERSITCVNFANPFWFGIFLHILQQNCLKWCDFLLFYSSPKFSS